MKCRICSRCGGNKFKKTATGWKCEYCDTEFVAERSDVADAEDYVNFFDIEDESLRAEVFADTREERWKAAHRTITSTRLFLIPMIVGLVMMLILFSDGARFSVAWFDAQLLPLGITLIGAIPFFLRQKRVRAAKQTIRDIEANVGIS